MIDSCKRASAERITAVIPYFGYARQDRKDEGRVPITAKLVANLITRAGADRVLTMDLHAAADSGLLRRAGRSPVRGAGAERALSATPDIDLDEIVIVSPDEGSIKRALGHAKRLGGTLAIVDKRRTSADTTVQEHIIGGPVEGKVALMFDDMISTAGSITGAAKDAARTRRQGNPRRRDAPACCAARRSSGSKSPIWPASWSPIRSRSPTSKSCRKRECSPSLRCLGEAIKRIHRNESVSRLFR